MKSFARQHCIKCTAFVMLLALFAGLYILLVVINFQDDFYQSLTGARKSNVCETEACKKTAERLLADMDQSVDPCENFYRFACGNFLNTAEIRQDQTHNSSFIRVQEAVDEQLRSILQEKPSPSSSPSPYRIIRQIYQLCMDEKKIDARGVSPAVDMLQLAGGWPVLGQWSPEGWSPVTTEVNLRTVLHINAGSLFRLGVSTDSKNASRRVLEVDQPEPMLAREFLLKGSDDVVVQAYHSYMVDLAVLYGADRAAAQQQFTDCLLFEIELAKLLVPREERRDFERTYNPYTLRQLTEAVAWVDWRLLLDNLLPFTVSDDEPIIVNEPDYLVKLGAFLQKYPKQVVANHMMWKTAHGLANLLVSEMRDRQLEFRRVVVGQAARAPRWHECTNTVQNSLTIAVASSYVKRFFHEISKVVATDMAERIRQEMYLDLQELDWMDENTREHAKVKASHIVQHVGYPDELVNDTNVEQFYQGLTIDEENFFEALLDVRAWYQRYRFSLLRQPVDKTDWRTHSDVADVNAYYNPVQNSMQFPAGILQPPFFSSDLPRYINYGTIGFIMAHEITHGFDDEGCQFDYSGNLKEWWGDESKKRFVDRKKCIIDQYGSFNDSQTHLKVNGINTQGENVADVAGLKLSYRAYHRLLLTNPSPQPSLPGLAQYSPDQLMMVSMSNMWCTRYRPEVLRYLITTGVHSPAEFRVNGVLMNLPQFSQMFSCAADDPMNPQRKCTIW